MIHVAEVGPASYRERVFTFPDLEIVVTSVGFYDKQYAFGVKVTSPAGEQEGKQMGGPLWISDLGQPMPPPTFEYANAALGTAAQMYEFTQASSFDDVLDKQVRRSKRIGKDELAQLREELGELYVVTEGVPLETLEAAVKELVATWTSEFPREMMNPKDLPIAKERPSRSKPKWRK